MDVSSQLIWWYATVGDNFPFNIVTDDESWFHHSDPETKGEIGMESHNITIKRGQNCALHWQSNWNCLLGCWRTHTGWFLPKQEVINMVCYIQTLRKLQYALCDKHLMKQTVILEQHNTAWPHTAHLTSETIAENGREVLPYPPHSLDLVSSDYHLLTSLEYTIFTWI
jgi:hypothetical protein